MNIEVIKERLITANLEYRKGTPSLTDQDYDDLLETLKGVMTPTEYEDFVSSLNEGGIEKNVDGKIKHPFVMGSLEKIKYEEPETIKKWIRENIKNGMSVSAKVDGISSRAEYKDGKLVSLTTRGDGTFGMDITSKAKYIKFLPSTLNHKFTGNIRGELVILSSDFETIKDNYANPRNACAGIMNRKDGDKKFNEKEARLISFIPYTILGKEYTKSQQFGLLEAFGFNVAWNCSLTKESACEDDIVEWLFASASDHKGYETDGLVICDVEWKNEDKYRPDGCRAFKTNQSIAVTKVIGFDWGTPSANGKFTPVALLKPVEIAGTIVKRVTCNNITWMKELGVEIGKTVRVCKRGDIIPAIVEVLD